MQQYNLFTETEVAITVRRGKKKVPLQVQLNQVSMRSLTLSRAMCGFCRASKKEVTVKYADLATK